MLANAQILGCMDPNACNYNPLANVSNGSCQYSYNESINMFDLDTSSVSQGSIGNGAPTSYIVLNDMLFFLVQRTELWKYDPAIDSAMLVYDINPGQASSAYEDWDQNGDEWEESNNAFKGWHDEALEKGWIDDRLKRPNKPKKDIR